MAQAKRGIIYRGPSLIDGSPIVAVAVFTKANKKTGGMLQTYILSDTMHPMEAIKTGADVSICGQCPHRGNGTDYKTRSCYVNVAQGPSAIYRALQRGSYDVCEGVEELAELGRDRMVRLGTYGDPMAVPAFIWSMLISDAIGNTGYTHQWMAYRSDVDEYRAFLMASADSVEDYRKAQAMDWRTFRVRTADEPLQPTEFVCPAAHEAKSYGKVQCADCKACDGASGRKGSPAIIAHGTFKKRFPINVVTVN